LRGPALDRREVVFLGEIFEANHLLLRARDMRT
jgi:hypothetical protein